MSLPTTEPITPVPTPPPAAVSVPQAPAKPEAVQTPEPNPEDALRAPGLKALEAERERAKKAESQLAAIEPYKKVLDGLNKLFTPEGAEQPKPEDLIQKLTERLDQADRKAAVNELARTHGITSDDDIALLDAVADPQQREALALRLKGVAAAIPPDPGQGNHPGTQTPEDAAYNAFFPDTRK
ncbi:hypothetical protein ATK74_1760 [Propionicimonas paludicola]|uniref:Uncharacterized protein n=1 Tax=Propionicimonas paludicola TaxID=185243 RepID=A0A2A9CRX5_9ACTN|nr:hypothetical protein [Propionicimonas paludicola]PFG17197.1 hypothetical protein ATK74_1760 [Propionicimonas paludicola]